MSVAMTVPLMSSVILLFFSPVPWITVPFWKSSKLKNRTDGLLLFTLCNTLSLNTIVGLTGGVMSK